MTRTINNMHTPTVAELLTWLQTHDHLFYMPPMDVRPSRVIVTSRIKTWVTNPHRFTVTIKAPSLRFRIDEKHLDRIYLPDANYHTNNGLQALEK